MIIINNKKMHETRSKPFSNQCIMPSRRTRVNGFDKRKLGIVKLTKKSNETNALLITNTKI